MPGGRSRGPLGGEPRTRAREEGESAGEMGGDRHQLVTCGKRSKDRSLQVFEKGRDGSIGSQRQRSGHSLALSGKSRSLSPCMRRVAGWISSMIYEAKVCDTEVFSEGGRMSASLATSSSLKAVAD